MILTIAVSGYRSLRDVVLPLDQLTVITGENGTGKSSLYKSIQLLAGLAQGRTIRGLAEEGGLQSTLWAGPESISRAVKSGEYEVQGTVRKDRVRLRLGFASDDYGYAADLGLPPTSSSKFSLDPEIKAEAVWIGEHLKRSNVIAARKGPGVEVMQENGTREHVITSLSGFDSMMTHAADPRHARELLIVRERMRAWRFYDQLRTDKFAPARQVQIGTRTVSLSSDGSDLASAVQTIFEIGDQAGFDAAIDDAFPGSEIYVEETGGRFELFMKQHGLLRALQVSELSDGTLRYLLLVAALFTPRPPELLVLNEPETSLHPSLLEPLARLISAVAATTQIILVSHATSLVKALEGQPKSMSYRLYKEFGETKFEPENHAKWEWPRR